LDILPVEVEKMKNMFKAMMVVGTMAGVAGGIYLMNDKKAMKKAGKKVISAMDSAESMIAKKIN
jgi:formylmethanofuran:tetrahydromethanopterin formyltransferase